MECFLQSSVETHSIFCFCSCFASMRLTDPFIYFLLHIQITYDALPHNWNSSLTFHHLYFTRDSLHSGRPTLTYFWIRKRYSNLQYEEANRIRFCGVMKSTVSLILQCKMHFLTFCFWSARPHHEILVTSKKDKVLGWSG